jgi:hypothetical protein
VPPFSCGSAAMLNVCYVVPGQERLLANAMGGSYELEGCGFFANCDDATRRYYEGPAGWDYVEIWGCSADSTRAPIAAVVVLSLLVVAAIMYFRIRKKFRQGGAALGGVPMLTEEDGDEFE